MFLISNVQTADAYTEALTLGPVPTTQKIVYLVANAGVIAQVAGHSDSQTVEPWGDEILITPSSGEFQRIQGIRFRSAVLGAPARVVAQLITPDDPVPSGGTPFTASLSGSGTVTPGANAVQVQKDGTLIGTEPILDFLIANQVPKGGIALAASDDVANTRTLLSFSLAAELGFAQLATNVTANTVAEAAALTVVTAPTIAFDGSTLALVEFWCPAFIWGGGVTGGINLWDNGVNQGRIFDASVVLGTSAGAQTPGYCRHRLIPTAGNHTYSIRIWNSLASNFIAYAGAGGAGAPLPGGIRVAVAS